MPPSMLLSFLERTGKLLNRWNAQIRVDLWVSILLVCLGISAFSDMSLQFEKLGRISMWAILVVLGAITAQRLRSALSFPRTHVEVAADIEAKFPQLDNRLINFLQFSSDTTNDPFKAAYVQRIVPQWDSLNLEEMKDRRKHLKATAFLVASAVLLLLPFPVVGKAWSVSLYRIINPFSDIQPISMTHIVKVAPGDGSVMQGGNLGLACTVNGMRGHEVLLDIKPSDGEQNTIKLGSLRGGAEEFFSNQVYKVMTVTKYRFRAGDAFSPRWYTITPRPPLAFTTINLDVIPPKYTGLAGTNYNEKSSLIDVPHGSTVKITVEGNQALATLTGGCRESEVVALTPSSDKTKWEGSFVVTNGSALRLSALSSYGDNLETALPYNLLPDRPPAITVNSPKGGATLAAGVTPTINFEISDDYGLTEITIQRMSSSSTNDTLEAAEARAAKATKNGETVKTYKWSNSRTKDFTTIWNGEAMRPRESGAVIFRIVARDNSPDNPRVTVSPPIVFNALTAQLAATARKEQEKKAIADLSRVIDMQRENLGKTKMYQGILKSATAENWDETAGKQRAIRELTKELLARSGNVMGNLAGAVKKLYAKEMADAIALLENVGTSKAEERAALVEKSILMEDKILRQLTFAEVGVAQEEVKVRMTALSAQLEKLVKDQTKLMKTTSDTAIAADAKGSALATEQDGLASDLTAFRQACLAESAAAVGDDKKFSDFLIDISKMVVEKKVREDMVLAAESLDKDKIRDAIPLELSARDKLVLVLQRFNEVAAADEKEEKLAMIEALQNANKKLEKVKDLEKKMIEAMDSVKELKDKDKKKTDKMEEDFKEIDKQVKEALLEVPKDLDIFTELNAGTDMVEDMFTTFEEVQQQTGSDQLGPDGKVKTLAPAKREAMLDGMEEAKSRLDELETYLKTAPDALKITTEAFDKEEMPKAGVALVPLLTKTEQIIGDLLNESKELQDKDQDGAINSATPDLEADGPITEGDVTSYSARGQVGNETPDHKEQDGRSNVGRQGMATGETAAGGGTIAKGDENIEARRTEDPPQSGQVNVDGEADTKATGGGKVGTGKADGFGQGGGIKRMDSNEAGSLEAMAAMMAKQTDATYAEASMKNLKADSLKSAAHHMRQAADAVAKGNISQVAEFKKKALGDLKKAKMEMESSNGGNRIDAEQLKSVVEDVVASSPDDAPPKYKDLVADYYKKLNEML